MSNPLARQVLERLSQLGLYVVPVESCTGGALANTLTDQPGASRIISNGFVVYSNEAKMKLGVPPEAIEAIEAHTVYSEETAKALAKIGLARAARGDIGVGITGSLTRVDPANPNSIPGEAYIAVVWKTKTLSKKIQFRDDDRIESKAHLVNEALQLILAIVA